MTKMILLAAAGLALTACAQTRPEPVRTVFLSGPGQHYVHSGPGGQSRVMVIRRPDAGRPLVLDRRYVEVAPMARLGRPDAEALARLRRDAEAQGARARALGEMARRRGEAARIQGEAARARGEEVRQRAEQLRRQCERGEIECEIYENGVRIR